jgi:uncharacterized protein with von Willebrand factor type A (vWA) domain
VSGDALISAPAGSIVERVTQFCRALRENGLLATPAESIEAARLLERIDFIDREEVYYALRTLLTTRREDLPIFDRLFANWWRIPTETPAHESRPAWARHAGAGVLQPPSPNGGMRGMPSMDSWARPDHEAEGIIGVAAPSLADARGRKDFATFGTDDLDEVSRVAERLARRLDARPSRRWRRASQGQGVRLDLRRTVRLSLKTGGDLVELARRRRKLRRTKLVVVCDVSGSMDLYSRFLLQFLYALQHAFARVETFAFSTRLVRITEALARDTYREALDDLARSESGWSGGTKIGGSIAALVAGWLRRIDRRTVVIILSDGWDTGEPEVLSDAMAAIHRRAGRVVWLNPLLGSPSYQPLTRGMQAALPHVDVFAAGESLESLERVGREFKI